MVLLLHSPDSLIERTQRTATALLLAVAGCGSNVVPIASNSTDLQDGGAPTTAYGCNSGALQGETCTVQPPSGSAIEGVCCAGAGAGFSCITGISACPTSNVSNDADDDSASTTTSMYGCPTTGQVGQSCTVQPPFGSSINGVCCANDDGLFCLTDGGACLDGSPAAAQSGGEAGSSGLGCSSDDVAGQACIVQPPFGGPIAGVCCASTTSGLYCYTDAGSCPVQ
jgi:hypothetical protein